MKLYRILVALFSALFFGYVCFRTFYPAIKTDTNYLKGVKVIVPALFMLTVLWGLDRFLLRKLKPKACKAAIVFLTFANTTLQVICIIYLKVYPSWDFASIMVAAADVAAGRPIHNLQYFQEYPYYLNPVVLIGTFKYLLGGSDWAPYILNILAVTVSIAGACLLAWRIFSPAVSVRVALFCLAATPLYLYAPIVYTDTLSMPFAVWSVYAWSFIRFPGSRPLRFGILPASAALGLLAAAGYLVKPVAAIGLIAFAVDYIMCFGDYKVHPGAVSTLHKKTRSDIRQGAGSGRAGWVMAGLAPVLVSALFFLIFISATGLYLDSKGFTSRLDRNGRTPLTHWLMMGMNRPFSEGGTSYGYGGFSNEDLKFTWSFKTNEEKIAAETGRIMERLNAFGVRGYAAFLLKKAEWTWTDGTYFAPAKLERLPIRLTYLHKFVLPNGGKSNRLYLAFTQLSQALLLFLMSAGALFSVRESGFEANRYMLLMCLGLAVFLLFWETRSRYLVFMIPIFIVLAASATDTFFKKVERFFRLNHSLLW